jgi:hypothetical protein
MSRDLDRMLLDAMELHTQTLDALAERVARLEQEMHARQTTNAVASKHVNAAMTNDSWPYSARP